MSETGLAVRPCILGGGELAAVAGAGGVPSLIPPHIPPETSELLLLHKDRSVNIGAGSEVLPRLVA